jgi:hypothetical protein
VLIKTGRANVAVGSAPMGLLNVSSQPIATGASFSDHVGKRDHDGDLLCDDPLPVLPTCTIVHSPVAADIVWSTDFWKSRVRRRPT